MARSEKSEPSKEKYDWVEIKLIESNDDEMSELTSYFEQEILEVFNLSNKVSLERLCTAFAIPKSLLGRTNRA